MKSLFKKTSPNETAQKNPELPKASKEEAQSDQSITSYFKDLARRKTTTSMANKQTDDIIAKKNSTEKKELLSGKSSFSGPKTSDDISVDSKLLDLGSSDFGFKILGNDDSRSNNMGSGDSINFPLKARKSTIRNLKTDSADKTAQEATGSTSLLLQRRATKKDVTNLSDSTDSISGPRRSSTVHTKDSLKARLELQRQELSTNFGPAINSAAPLSKIKLRESMMKSDSSSRFQDENGSSSSLLSVTGTTDEKVGRDAESSNEELQGKNQDKDIWKPSRQDVAKERWISAIQMVMRGIKSTAAMTGKPKDMEIIGAIKKEIIEDPQNLNAISGIIKTSGISKTDNQKAKIISLLRKPAFYRGPEQMNALDQVLKTLPAFSRYSKSFRMKLIEKGVLLDLEPYRVVVRQGGLPLSLYFLLSGKCLSETIVVKNGKGYIRRSNISAGESFGEFGMSSDEKRGYTVYTTVQSVVFSVPREAYIQMMKEEVMINKSEKIDVLRSIPAFQTLSATILDAVLASCHVFRYEPNIPLLKVGERDNVFFVLEGQCRANRLVPFLVKKEAQANSLTPEITGAYVPGAEPSSDESVVYYNMSIGLLGPGSFFPRISLLRHEGLQYRLQKFDVAKIIVLVNSILKHKPKDEPRADKTNIAAIFNQELSEKEADDLEDMIAGVDLSVTTIDKMTCLVISKMDLVKILPEEVLRDITGIDAEGLVGFSMSEIQQNYFDKIQWKGFRDEVVNNVIEKKSNIKKK